MDKSLFQRVVRLLALTLVVLGGVAQVPPSYADEHRCMHGIRHDGHGAMSAEKMRGKMADRMSRLHDSLKLTDEQESAWSEFDGQMKPAPDLPQPNFDGEELPAPERMARKIEQMKAHIARMEGHIPVLRAFYAELTPEQQKIFDSEFMHHRCRHHAEPKSSPDTSDL